MTRQRLRFASCLLSLGASLHGGLPLYQEPLPFEFHAYTGFRQDRLSFSIREKRERDHLHHLHHHRDRQHKDSCNHGCHSDDHHKDHHRHHLRGNEAKIDWKSLNMAQVGAIFNYSTYNRYCIKISADYGKILSGHANIDTRFHFKTLAPPEPETIPVIVAGEHWEDNLFGFNVHRRIHLDSEEDRELYSVLIGPEDVPVNRSHKKHRRRRHRRSSHQHAGSCHTLPERYIHHIEISKQRANANDGDVADLLGGIGWKVVSDSRRTSIAGLVGWSGSAQHVHLDQVVVERDKHNVVGLGPLCSASASYKTRWQGPWVGFDFVTLVDYNLTLFGSGEWHWASFQSSVDWRYGDFFDASFRQRARAYGVKGTLGIDWNFCSCWTLGIIGDYQQWSTKRGSNHTNITNKNLPSEGTAMVIPVIEKSTLHRARWTSFSVSAQVAYRF